MFESLFLVSTLLFTSSPEMVDLVNLENELVEFSEDPSISPNEYGFPDSYATSEHTQNVFTYHETSNGFYFYTRRYRTGYIHNEYVVMSPKRFGYNHAFIEYRFPVALNSIDVYLSHWRETYMEGLTSSTGTAVVQYYLGNTWTTVLDLLSSDTNLTTDRNNQTLYNIAFPQPIYRMRFYSSMNSAPTNDSNRGRICIGDMTFHLSQYNLPMSGSEIDYAPELWNDYVWPFNPGIIQINSNCYSYALNCPKNPFEDEYEFMQPGQGAGTLIDESNYEYILTHPSELVALVATDSQYYSFDFTAVDKNTQCSSGHYKVALVVDTVAPGYDYHWYRQNSDGYWSHKPGATAVTNKDSSGNYIIDPLTCDRGNYNLFVGYFSVRPLNFGF